MKFRVFLLTLALLSPWGAGFAFEPFFDHNPVTRHAPEPPELTELDLDMLVLCGDWGAPVEARDFEAVLLDPAHREALGRIHDALGGRVYTAAADHAEFVRQLRRAWFEQSGFKHVFCGEPGGGRDLGGFHYAPRYWQAQDAAWAGYRTLLRDHNRRPLRKCRQHYLRERIEPPIFSISISFINPRDPRNDVKCLGSYHLRMHAEKLLIAATTAFRQADRRVGPEATEACFHETRFDDVGPHYSNLVIRRRAIRTFYPLADEQPYCRRNRNDFAACLCNRL